MFKINQMKKFVFYLMSVSMFLTTACNDDPEKDVVVPVTGVTLEQSELTVAPNVLVQLRADVLPKNATNKAVTWSSNNVVVTIDSETGELTGTAGAATITVTTEDGGFSASRTVVVRNVPVTGINLVDTEVMLAPGGKRTLVANVLSVAATNKKINWSSDNTTVATVNASTGEVTGRAVGEAIITASTDEGGFEKTCLVTVELVNLLENPGFETQGSAYTEPSVWTKIPAAWFNSYYADPGNMAQYAAANINRIGLLNASGGVDAFFSTGNGRFFTSNNPSKPPYMTGSFVIRVEANRPGGYYQLVNVTSGVKYEFSIDVHFRRNAEAQTIKTNETIKILSPDGLTTYHEEPIVTDPSVSFNDANSHNNITVTGVVLIPEGVEQIRFQFDQRTYATTGPQTQSPLMLVDNCSFTQMPEEE